MCRLFNRLQGSNIWKSKFSVLWTFCIITVHRYTHTRSMLNSTKWKRKNVTVRVQAPIHICVKQSSYNPVLQTPPPRTQMVPKHIHAEPGRSPSASLVLTELDDESYLDTYNIAMKYVTNDGEMHNVFHCECFENYVLLVIWSCKQGPTMVVSQNAGENHCNAKASSWK